MESEDGRMRESVTLPHKGLAEIVGTFTLVFFGVGSVHAAVPTGAQQGVWPGTIREVGERSKEVLNGARWEEFNGSPARR